MFFEIEEQLLLVVQSFLFISETGPIFIDRQYSKTNLRFNWALNIKAEKVNLNEISIVNLNEPRTVNSIFIVIVRKSRRSNKTIWISEFDVTF